ncbi:MAG: chemotaxis protein CheB, partial [Thermoanaerobaculia bacterium]
MAGRKKRVERTPKGAPEAPPSDDPGMVVSEEEIDAEVAAEAAAQAAVEEPAAEEPMAGPLEEPTRPEVARRFAVVGVGASAGGLEAFTQLLSHTPPETGMAFVLISHLDPAHESMLDEILGRATAMPVRQVTDGMALAPNSVYVIPPNFGMELAEGVFRLVPRAEGQGRHMPVDHFFRSLAEHHKSRAIGVILSGTNSDGMLGMKAIKAEGGVTFAQDEASAKFSEMPRAAIAAGWVDYVLPPDQIGRELARVVRHPIVHAKGATPIVEIWGPADRANLNRVFALLRASSGVDFSQYRLTTIRRRIARRMILNRVDTLEAYARSLRGLPAEVRALYEDLLITVTTFFRDPATFELLENKVLPQIIRANSPGSQIRIWVPGSSTGEEVYSIAIALSDAQRAAGTTLPAQIFATDVSDKAIEKARNGFYSVNDVVDVSPKRLKRYFVKEDHGYRIDKSIRDLCVFAKQNVAADPPFSNLDLLSCRNLLIYLEPTLQKRVIPLFHYALKTSGFLMLGSAETLGTFSDLFLPLDKTQRIYTKRRVEHRPFADFPRRRIPDEPLPDAPAEDPVADVRSAGAIAREADRIVLGRFGPPGVIVDEHLQITQFRGKTSSYLESGAGVASFNVLKMAREGLVVELRSALELARKSDARHRTEPFTVRREGEQKTLSLEVIPVRTTLAGARHFLVLFEEHEPPAAPRPR